MVVTDKEKLQKAMQAIKDDKKELALRLLTQVAESFSAKNMHDKAARIFEKAGLLARDIDLTDEALGLVEKATVEHMRKASDVIHTEIVRLNLLAAEIAMTAKNYGAAAEYCFRAVDFASDDEKDKITLKAVEALESLADRREEEGKLKDTIGLVKKVSRLYYSLGDEELGARVNDRALRTAFRWAEIAKQEGNHLEVGNALGEAAQILQSGDEFVEAARQMIDAGEQYEAVHLYEKAGNIYDAAQEVFLLERLTSARNQAMFKAAEAYVKMDGKPEVVAPLMVKAGDMFSELNSEMKARWAYKRANELFEELANKAAEDQDVESEKMYLRYQAMCLKKWGNEEEAEEIYNDVIGFFLNEAKSEEQNENKELEAASLEAAADTLVEAERNDEARIHRERAIELYVELADMNAASGTPDESSRFYSKAAESAGKLGDLKRKESFHWIASEKAEEASKLYEDLDVQELATVWTRTAGLEALNVDQDEMRDKGTDLLEKSAQGFKSAGEQEEAFEDLFTVYETIFKFGKDDSRARLDAVVKEMDDIAKRSKDEKLLATIGVIHAVQKDKYIAALLALQEKEEELLDRRDTLRAIIKKGSSERGSH